MSTNCPVCGSKTGPGVASCPSCGFKLLGSTQRFEPISLDGAAAVPGSGGSAARARLHIVRGPQAEVVFDLGDKPLSVGRSPQCDIFLNDMTVSREHARVIPVEGGYEVIDQNSYNGVWVNNESVDRRRLEPGDVVQMGVFCLAYEEE